jgi:hypothetical protein
MFARSCTLKTEEEIFALLRFLKLTPDTLAFVRARSDKTDGTWSVGFREATYKVMPQATKLVFEIDVKWTRFHHNDGRLGIDYDQTRSADGKRKVPVRHDKDTSVSQSQKLSAEVRF